MMFLISKMMPMPSNSMKDDMVLMMIGSLIGHLEKGLSLLYCRYGCQSFYSRHHCTCGIEEPEEAIKE